MDPFPCRNGYISVSRWAASGLQSELEVITTTLEKQEGCAQQGSPDANVRLPKSSISQVPRSINSGKGHKAWWQEHGGREAGAVILLGKLQNPSDLCPHLGD